MSENAGVNANIAPGFVGSRRPGVMTIEIDGDAIIYDSERNVVHLLNATGALVWERYDGRSRLDELAGDLAREFGVGREQILADVMALTNELSGQGLLEEVAIRSPG